MAGERALAFAGVPAGAAALRARQHAPLTASSTALAVAPRAAKRAQLGSLRAQMRDASATDFTGFADVGAQSRAGRNGAPIGGRVRRTFPDYYKFTEEEPKESEEEGSVQKNKATPAAAKAVTTKQNTKFEEPVVEPAPLKDDLGFTQTTGAAAMEVASRSAAGAVPQDYPFAFLEAFLEDVAERPTFYLNLSGITAGVYMLSVVLSNLLNTINSIPFIPELLKLLGMAYALWFAAKYAASQDFRKNLNNDVNRLLKEVKD